MIPNKHPHTGPPGRLVTWGTPWHGPHQDGEVTLPNGAKMALPQADQGANGGDVIVFRPPGTTLPPRPPEWLAADELAGREWRDYALITGRNPRTLYGKSLGKGHGCWLYAAPDGSRWLISVNGMTNPVDVNFTVAWNITLTATRFGDIAVGAKDVGEWSTAPPAVQETYTTGATLSDWQQAITGKSGGDYSIDTLSSSVTTGKVWLEDASITGRHAVFMAGRDYPDEPIKRRSLGFVQIAMTGTPGVDWTATLSVLRTRAQTLGTYINTEDLSDAPYVSLTFPSPVQINQDSASAGDPPTCGGYYTFTCIPQAPTYAVTAEPAQAWTRVGTATFRHGIEARIVAMAYTGDSEAAGEVRMDAVTEGVVILHPPEGSYNHPTIWTQESVYGESQGVCGPQGFPLEVASRFTEQVAQRKNGWSTSSVKMTMPDGATITAPFTGTIDSIIVRKATDTASGAAVGPTEVPGWERNIVTRSAGGRTLAYDDAGSYWGPSPMPYSALITYVPFLNFTLTLGSSNSDGFFADRMYQACNPPGTFSSENHGISYFKTQLRRYSNKLWEFESVEFFRLADGTDQPLRTIQMGAAGTGGQVNSTITTEAGQTVPPYGSHNPESGEIKRAQALPVVYI